MAKSQRDGGKRNRNREQEARSDDFIEKLVTINRTAKVVKGGSRFRFSALVVVGDGHGQVGIGMGKAKEVPESIRKATERAKRNLMRIVIKDGRTLYHEAIGRHGAGLVVLRPASEGTGIISGGPIRPIFECLGIRDVLTKSIGSSNPNNMIKATLNALKSIRSPEDVAKRRGTSMDDVRVV